MTSPFNFANEHLEELRRRILVSFLEIIACSAAAYVFSEEITRLCMIPLSAGRPEMIKLVYTSLPEAFVAYLKLSLIVGILTSFPLLLYEAWMFVAPGLVKRERSLVLRVVFVAVILFAGGVVFAYFIVLPQILSYFMGFANADLEPLPKLSGYLTFIARTCLAFGLAFQIPFLMVAAVKTGLVPHAGFRKKRKYYYPAIALLALLLTAGDLFSGVLLAFPLFGLYEGGILVIRLFTSPENPAHEPRNTAEETSSADDAQT